MANRQNLIDTYLNNPTLQSKYTQQQYLDLFGFGQSTPTPAPPPPTTPTPPVENIIGQNLNQDRGGGGGIQELQQTFTRTQPRGPKFDPNINPAAQLTGAGRLDPMGSDVDYFNAFGNDPRRFDFGFTTSSIPGQEGYQAPSKYFEEPSMMQKGITGIKDFFTNNRFFQPKVAGTLGTRLANQPKIPGAAMILNQITGGSPFDPASKKYNYDLENQLNYLEGLTATGQNMIGRDPGTGGLKYGTDSVLSGKNVISGFGTNNYDTALRNFISKMQANTRISAERKAARLAAAEKELLDLQTKSKKGLGRDVDRGGFDPSGPTQRSIRAEREDKSGKGQSGGFTNPGKGSYGPHMADGGLATMFVEKR